MKGCETVLKEAPLTSARETLPNVAAKLESTAECGMVPIPPITNPPNMSKSWLIREAVQCSGKMKEETLKKKSAHELCQLLTSLTARTIQFMEGRPTYT